MVYSLLKNAKNRLETFFSTIFELFSTSTTFISHSSSIALSSATVFAVEEPQVPFLTVRLTSFFLQDKKWPKTDVAPIGQNICKTAEPQGPQFSTLSNCFFAKKLFTLSKLPKNDQQKKILAFSKANQLTGQSTVLVERPCSIIGVKKFHTLQ